MSPRYRWEILEVLEKYKLDAEKALQYFKENFSELNTLSKKVIEFVPFEKGEFYTYLEKGVSEKQLHDFEGGFVADYARDKVLDEILGTLKSEQSAVCMFDDFNGTSDISKKYEIYKKVGVDLDGELYYLIQNDEVTKEILIEAFQMSDTIWHSLCVISTGVSMRREDRTQTEEDCTKIAQEALFVIALAYDAESYIVWQKN